MPLFLHAEVLSLILVCYVYAFHDKNITLRTWNYFFRWTINKFWKKWHWKFRTGSETFLVGYLKYLCTN